MNCPKCKNELKAGAKFCTKCGTKTEGLSTTSVAAVKVSSTFNCPKCKNELKAGAKFCTKCGHKMEAASSSTSAESPRESVKKTESPRESVKKTESPRESGSPRGVLKESPAKRRVTIVRQDSTGMIKCAKCSALLKEGSKFCTKCGAKGEQIMTVAKKKATVTIINKEDMQKQNEAKKEYEEAKKKTQEALKKKKEVEELEKREKEKKREELEKKKEEIRKKRLLSFKKEESSPSNLSHLASPRVGEERKISMDSSHVSSSMDLTAQSCFNCKSPLKTGSKFCTKCGKGQTSGSSTETAESVKLQAEKAKIAKLQAEEKLKKEKQRLEVKKQKELEEARQKAEEEKKKKIEAARMRASRRKIETSATPTATSSTTSKPSTPSKSLSSTPASTVPMSKESSGLEDEEGDIIIDGEELLRMIENEVQEELKGKEKKIKQEIDEELKKTEDEIFNTMSLSKKETEEIFLNNNQKKKEKLSRQTIFDNLNFDDLTSQAEEELKKQSAEAQAQFEASMRELEEAEKRMQEIFTKMSQVEKEVEIKFEQVSLQNASPIRQVEAAPRAARIRTMSKSTKNEKDDISTVTQDRNRKNLLKIN